MTGTPRIVPLEPGIAGENGTLELDHVLDDAVDWTDERGANADRPPWDQPEPPALPPERRTILLAAGGAVAAWTLFYVWANLAAIRAGASAAQWAEWLVMWSVPLLLVLTGLLVVLRTSRREALRFADAARALNDESARLETRLVTVNGELSLAREFVASQSRDLEALGRIATERLSQTAERLSGLIHANSAQIESISLVSANALENMDKLRGQLPVIANAAKDVTNNIGNAGRTAHAQLHDMANGFHRLNEFGQASERQMASIRDTVAAAVAEFTGQAEQLENIAAARFEALASEGEELRRQLDAREAEALDAWRSRVAGLAGEAHTAWAEVGRVGAETAQAAQERLAELTAAADELHAGIAERARELGGEILNRRAELEIAGRSAIEGLRSRFAEIDAGIQAQRERHLEQSREVAQHAAWIGERLGAFGEAMGALGAHGDEVAGKLDRGIGVLAEKLAASREALAGTDRAIAELTAGGERLLDLIEATTERSRDQLPAALTGTEGRLEQIQASVVALRDALGEAGSSGQALADHVLAARSGIGEAAGELSSLHGGIEAKTAQNQAQMAAIREEIAQARSESEALAAQVQTTLQAAIDRLAAAARETALGLAAQSEAAVEEVAERLGERSAEAIEQAMGAQAEQVIGQLEAAVARAATASREAAIHLRDQLARVDELAGNLERRVSHARERAEEQVDGDFSRRAALITESLKSAAIDIAKAFSADVSDTAWEAYLRGDRGIFTRRAVALLDGAEARGVVQHYEADRDFRENVNHYIHDFEAMLRSLLSTRDGNALGVTLLSSDMGKLYVALAQGIERIRT